MNQEEYLDQLLEAQRYGRTQASAHNDEITASLAAAEMLTRLREIEVPAEFTSRLEASLRARISSRRLIQPNSQTLSNENILPLKRRRSSANTRRAPRQQAWIALLGIAAMLVMTFAGLLALSAHTLPGGSLAGPRHVGNQATSPVVNNSPQSQLNVDILLLRNALVDLRSAANNQRSDAVIQLALQTVAARSHDCQNAVKAVPGGPDRDTAQQNLNAALTGEEQTVRQLLTQVDWPMRMLFTQQLGALGDPVPTITHVSVHTQSNGTYLVTLTGTHFAPQARLLFKGQPDGTVSQAMPDQLVAIIHSSQGLPDTHAFGVLNPDGTAAQLVRTGGDDHNGSGTSTPYPDN
jgi:hypothetical protein